MYSRFRPNAPAHGYGKDREYCIDLIPKFLMASGEFIDILSNLDLSRYIEFVQIEGSFVYREGKGISKVPSVRRKFSYVALFKLFL